MDRSNPRLEQPSPAGRIPRILHYCWYGGSSLSPLGARCLESWRAHTGEFELRRWDESTTPFVAAYPKAAHARGEWSRLSNWTRLHALLRYGGIYLDTDVELLQPLDPLLEHDAFAGFQSAEPDVDWVNGAILGARAGHPSIAKLLAATEVAFEGTGEFPRGPQMTTRLLREAGLRRYGRQRVAGVDLYPTWAFYPWNWHEAPAPERVTPQTFAIHHWEGSWLPERARSSPRS